MWLARDAVAGPAAAQKLALADAFESDLRPVLESPQQARLRQLVLRAQGWPALTSDELAGALELSAAQTRRIDEIAERTHREIQQASQSASPAAERETAIAALRKREGTAIQKLLSSQQRARLAELVGETYDLSRVGPLVFAAPQLKQVDAWVGSPPLELAELRGKVVAFHFWAFGCINCLRNLPHYNAWHERLGQRGLVVLGMHTPETSAERAPAALGPKVEEFAIRYPVAADHENQNWAAWGNSMWPSVYLVDKRGRVRYWWYGELNWQGAEGEKFMRGKIEELLAERD
jgi:thiol-disulfide isomerase/thioredoxin